MCCFSFKKNIGPLNVYTCGQGWVQLLCERFLFLMYINTKLVLVWSLTICCSSKYNLMLDEQEEESKASHSHSGKKHKKKKHRHSDDEEDNKRTKKSKVLNCHPCAGNLI